VGCPNDKCIRQPALRLDRARVERQGVLEQVYGFLDILAHTASAMYGAPPEKVIQRIGSLRLAGGLRADQLPAECVGDATSDLVLYGEEIPDIVVETLRPKMRVGCRINKLRIDPNLVPRAPDTPRTRRRALICTVRLAFSTTDRRQTVAMISSFVTN
jgi:hypothetical protein